MNEREQNGRNYIKKRITIYTRDKMLYKLVLRTVRVSEHGSHMGKIEKGILNTD
jgi:hypothetical protein